LSQSDPAPPVSCEPAAAVRRNPFLRIVGGIIASAAPLLASIVLLAYPWTNRWERNRFAALLPVWDSGYLRGAISGLGVVSLSLSLTSLVRIRRRTR